uniref:Venom protein n=1 Tax=Ascaris lumbricoides TaxID=6252 RepID=A0A0M3HFD7_ASCLU
MWFTVLCILLSIADEISPSAEEYRLLQELKEVSI